MPNFTNPFPGMREAGDLDNEEIVRALRLDLAAEQDATHIYTAQAARTRNQAVKNTLLDIANEEKVHTGELMRLIMELDKDEVGWLDKGFNEVETREHLEHEVCVQMMAESLRAGRQCSVCAR
jgi:rubrerythrin